MTSDNEETVHQQCGIDQPAPGNAGIDGTEMVFDDVANIIRSIDRGLIEPRAAAVVLRAEVFRLRECAIGFEAEVHRLREELERSRHGLGETIKMQGESIERLRSELELKITASAQIAAENVRLREELAVANEANASQSGHASELETKLARVEALLPEWRADSSNSDEDVEYTMLSVIADLETALNPILK